MNRKQGRPKGSGRRKPGAPNLSPRPARRRLLAGVAAVIVLAALAAGLARLRPSTPLPQIRLDGVEDTVRRVIERHVDDVRSAPRSADAWGWLGAILRTYHFDDASEVCLAEAERLDPRNPRWPHFRSKLWTATDPQRAMEAARRASDLAGHQPPYVRHRYARLIAEEGRWDQARALLQDLTQAQPDYTPALLLLAHAALTAGQADQALAMAQRCTSDPTTARSAWSLLAQAHQRLGDPQRAAQAAARAASLPVDTPPQDPYLDELSLRRGDPREMSILCHGLLAGRQLDQASAIIDRLMRDHAEHAETWLLRGRLQLLLQQPAKAETSLRRHLALEADSTQGWFQLGTALLRQGKHLEAGEAFGRAIQLKPDFGPAWFNRALALGQLGNLREALDAFEECLRHNPEHVDAYFFLADLHLRLGEPDQARARLAQAQTLAPQDPRLDTFRTRLSL